MYINLYVLILYTMLEITKNKRKIISVEIEWMSICLLKDSENILMTKKELSKFFATPKDLVKNQLENTDYRSIEISRKTKKYYSINDIIILGYKLKKYKETKTLVLLQRYIKNHSNNGSFLGRMKKIYTHIDKVVTV